MLLSPLLSDHRTPALDEVRITEDGISVPVSSPLPSSRDTNADYLRDLAQFLALPEQTPNLIPFLVRCVAAGPSIGGCALLGGLLDKSPVNIVISPPTGVLGSTDVLFVGKAGNDSRPGKLLLIPPTDNVGSNLDVLWNLSLSGARASVVLPFGALAGESIVQDLLRLFPRHPMGRRNRIDAGPTLVQPFEFRAQPLVLWHVLHPHRRFLGDCPSTCI
jgi:hypothetical protein